MLHTAPSSSASYHLIAVPSVRFQMPMSFAEVVQYAAAAFVRASVSRITPVAASLIRARWFLGVDSCRMGMCRQLLWNRVAVGGRHVGRKTGMAPTGRLLLAFPFYATATDNPQGCTGMSTYPYRPDMPTCPQHFETCHTYSLLLCSGACCLQSDRSSRFRGTYP